jgi:hypothetical protein
MRKTWGGILDLSPFPIPFPIVEEIADFLASCPSPEELLRFRPSPQTQARAEELLDEAEGWLPVRGRT